jgi:hypothetical protein
MSEYNEFITKTQADILGVVKQAQENNVKAIQSFGDAVAEYATRAKSFSPDTKLPTPTEVIESAFGFTAQLVELQKNYYVKMAETFATAQKKATETVAHAAKK